MSVLKGVVIKLPETLSRVSSCARTAEIPVKKTNLKFTKSILSSRSVDTMDCKPTIEQLDEAMCRDGELVKPEMWLRGKKRRLDHLTWEEKLQRKKLKNRVAAQTSRDRKKAKLDELEDTVKALRESNELLTKECTLLRAHNETLIEESKRLKRERDERRSITMKQKNEYYCANCCRTRVGCAAPTLGSAVSPKNPLPQGGTAQPASLMTIPSQNVSIILKIMTLYLLSRNYSASSRVMSTSSDLKNLPRAFCEKLPQKWKRALVDQMNRSRSSKIPLKNLTIQKEWWGRHQKMWKPVQSSKA